MKKPSLSWVWLLAGACAAGVVLAYFALFFVILFHALAELTAP